MRRAPRRSMLRAPSEATTPLQPKQPKALAQWGQRRHGVQRLVSLLHVGEPVPVLFVASADNSEVRLLQLGAERRRTRLELAPVDLANRRHFGCRTRQEDFVGSHQLVARESS